MIKNSQQNLTFLICLLLAAIIFVVFCQVYNFDFISLDDPLYVYENPNIQDGITLKTIKWAFSTNYLSYWHPLTWLSHALDVQLFELNPGGHHLTNLVFHIVNSILILIFLKKITDSFWPAVFAAFLFALHPLHVESVAWVSERKDMLSTFFWLLTMLAYMSFVKNRRKSAYLAVILFYICALMSKPMAVTLPFVLLLLDYWPLERFQGFNRQRTKQLVLEKVPMIILAVILSVITFIAQHSNERVMNLADYPLKLRIFNAVVSYTEYIFKMIWPTRLAVFYPYPSDGISLLKVIISGAVLLTITVLVFYYGRRCKYLITGWFWYLVTLLPVIGLVQVGQQSMADRYSYIPLTGLFIIIAWGVPALFGNWQYQKITLFISAVLVIFSLSLRSYVQLGHWKNSETLFSHALEVTEDNDVAHFCICGTLFEQDRLDEVIYHCNEVLRIDPNSSEASNGLAMVYNKIGIALCQQGRHDEGIIYFKKALEMAPEREDTKNNLELASAEKEHLKNKEQGLIKE